MRSIARAWARGLPGRHGGALGLGALAAILALGLGLRLGAALDPVANPRSDSVNYQRIATALYHDQRFGDEGMTVASDYSPGAPLLFAAVYYATGAPYAQRALIAVALLGAGMVLLVYLLGRRLAGAGRLGLAAGLGAALVAAVYPSYIEYSGKLMSEPVAAFFVAAAVLAFLWALERQRARVWAVPGLLLGGAVLTRPEYLAVAAALAVVALVVVMRRDGRRAGLASAAVLAAACVVVIAPWTVRNALVLDRFVPVSTGGGKALFVGTYLPGDGSEPEVRRVLLERSGGRFTDFDQVLDSTAARHPELDRDQALARTGRENLRRYAGEQPGAYAEMLAAKLGRIWWRGPAGTADYSAWVWLHRAIVVLGLLGLALLVIRRARSSALVLALPLAVITAIGMLLLASTRRSAPLMPLVLALAAVGVAWALAAVAGRVGTPMRRPRGAAPGPSRAP